MRIAVDASTEVGWGAVVIHEHREPETLKGVWSLEMRKWHIFVLEVVAVCKAVAAVIDHYKGHFMLA